MSESIEFRSFNHHRIASVVDDAGGRRMVVFCHGFRSTSTGPSRSFVVAARRLSQLGISSLRFDQYGSGNSDGDFGDSSFGDWVATTEAIVQQFRGEGHEVALFGQSMGASAAIVVAARVPKLSGLVAWVPDPKVDELTLEQDFVEEGGQLVGSRYWREAAHASVHQQLALVQCPACIVQCAEDELVTETNRRAINERALPHHYVETLEGFSHSSWTHDQFTAVIGKSVDFLESVFR